MKAFRRPICYFGYFLFFLTLMYFILNGRERTAIPIIAFETLESNPEISGSEIRVVGYFINKVYFPMGLYPTHKVSEWDETYVMPGIKILDETISRWPTQIDPVKVEVTGLYESDSHPKASYGAISNITNIRFIR